MYKLKEFIDIDKLDWNYLSANPNTLNVLEEYLETSINQGLTFNCIGILSSI